MAIEITPLRGSDRPLVKKMLEDTRVFRPEEIDVALEVVDALLKEGPDYLGAAARENGALLGWACWGATACTRGTFDLYWIAVDPTLHGRGVGRRLMAHAEADMRRRGGRLCVVETSGLPIYVNTRAFYDRVGYRETARIPDYYDRGDDLVVFTRSL